MKRAGTIAMAALLLAAPSLFASEIPQAERRSGYSFMAPDTQAIQDDDTANPGMLWVLDGEKLWNIKTGAAGKACADCHNDARTGMKGVFAPTGSGRSASATAVPPVTAWRIPSRTGPSSAAKGSGVAAGAGSAV